MILGPVKRASKLARFTSTNPTPGGLGKESELKWPQKGDFNGEMSFAIGSILSGRTSLGITFATSSWNFF